MQAYFSLDRLIYIYALLQQFADGMWKFLSQDIFSFISFVIPDYTILQAIFDLLEDTAVGDFLSSFTFFEFLFGYMLYFAIAVSFLRWILPIITGSFA